MTAYEHYTDHALLESLANDDREAFNALFSRHWDTLYQSAYYILKDQEGSKDIVQDIFIWLWEHRRHLSIQQPKAYLKAAVKFKVANYIRAGNIREGFFTELSRSVLPTTIIDTEARLELAELQSILEQAIFRLPEKCRQVFQLSREGSLTNQQIAERLGISVKTVENQMTIALRRIRSDVSTYLLAGTIFFPFL